MELTHRCIIVTGRVQGVGFRRSALRQAQDQGLAATARNLPDGAVEIHVEGPEQALEEFTSWARKGPPLARIDTCEYTDGILQGLSGTIILR
ncbi:MAG: acylphosphatase [Flavobacteriales bacterium]|nr:acylphosphatase [Flavobacteriales bacterium]